MTHDTNTIIHDNEFMNNEFMHNGLWKLNCGIWYFNDYRKTLPTITGFLREVKQKLLILNDPLK